MSRSSIAGMGFVLWLGLAVTASPAVAQTVGIAGVVRDTSGAAVPGVTVEAASPTLIEKARSVVTNAEGLYAIVDLRPGTYSVTFTLPGFSTVKREGIELTGSFTATVNAVLQIRDVQETITVVGAAPDVDVRNVVQQRVLAEEIREALPTGRHLQYMAELIPGISVTSTARGAGHDVGGVSDSRGAMMIHGSRSTDSQWQYDGAQITSGGLAGAQTYQSNPAEVREYVYELNGLSAETPSGGVRANIIPKEGGNRLTSYSYFTFSNSALQGKNLTQTLIDQGVTLPTVLKSHWDVNPSIGGPILKNRLWFYSAYRNWGNTEEFGAMQRAIDPKSFVFNPRLGAAGNVDLNRPATYFFKYKHYTTRLTGQANHKNKISLYGSWDPRLNDGVFMTGSRSYEASMRQDFTTNRLVQLTWKSMPRSSLLVEAQVTGNYMSGPRIATMPFIIEEGVVPVNDVGTGYLYRSFNGGYETGSRYSGPASRGSVAYVTGDHVMKFGFLNDWGFTSRDTVRPGNIGYTFSNGSPISITVYNTPYVDDIRYRNIGLYAQDQWKKNRFTVNAGLRLDVNKGSLGRQTSGPNNYAPFQEWPQLKNIPYWKDLSPRFGVVYDLFGTGKTAIKWTLNRYIVYDNVTFQNLVNPLYANREATRPWSDRNGDFIPQESELGTLSNSAFGTAQTTTRYDDALREGWRARQYDWETSVGVQHQLLTPLAVNVVFTRRSFGNFTVTDNRALTPADYDEYCITAPTDSRLGSVSGSRICGLYNLNPAKRTLTPDNFVTKAVNYGTQKETWQGLDVTLNARLPYHSTISGGLSAGPGNGNNIRKCFVVDSPEAMRFCDVNRPWLIDARFIGSIQLPWAIVIGASFISVPGPDILANYTVTNAMIGSTVQFVNPARTAFSGGSATVPLLEPGQGGQAARLNQVDLRITKGLKVQGVRVRLNVDFANMLNAAAPLLINNVYGSSWLRPNSLLLGRLVKLGTQIDW